MSGRGVRHWQVVLIFWGLSVTYALRVNLSVAVVAMTDSASVNPDFPISKPHFMRTTG
ncbi:GL10850 [Drosophila persimilis]|uniref:GL10850 n=1 Tax=Drosophila persimilis TaxID=7234 RepID=B4GDI6_DROPE|nr:GL10850 [Drosophila persimilis]